MAKIEGKCKKVMDKTEWVAIATCGENGSHVVATWGDFVKALATEDGGIIIISAGHYNVTEENLKKNNHIELLIASREVEGTYGTGQGELL